MKKAKFTAFFIAATSILFLAICANTVLAPYEGYSITVWTSLTPPTIDGKWTTDTEWDNAAIGVISDDAYFRIKWTSEDTIYDNYIVEFYSDNTNDTGDYVQICYDCSADGGTAPQTDDIRIDYVGHGGSAQVNTYKGTGSTWASAALTLITIHDSLDVSKMWSSAHWITDFKIAKTENGPNIDNAIRVAVYDASNPSAGVKAWPPTSQDVPNDYGADPADLSGNEIPESMAVGVIVILASVAVLVGSLCNRKLSRIGNCK